MPGSSPEGAEAEVKPTDAQATETAEGVKPVSEEKPAAEPKGETTVLDAVKAALDKSNPENAPTSEKPDPKSAAEPAADAKKDGADGEAESDDLSEEELTRLRPKTRKRIENLLADRTTRDRRIAELEPKAAEFDKVLNFVEDAGLSTDEVNRGFNVMRDLKRDPEKAYATLKPIVAQLAQMFGDTLPDDLQQEVAHGRLTEAHARELARSRSVATISKSEMDFRDKRAENQRTRDAQVTRVNQVQDAVTKWENTAARGDPDWKHKQDRVTELVELEVRRRQERERGYYPTPEEAVAISKAALEKVNGEFKRFAPKPRAITPTPDGASSQSTPKPTSILEAARQGLNKGSQQVA